MTRRIGIDVGGVIIDAIANDDTDTGFRGDNFMKTTAVPGVLIAVRMLVRSYGSANVFIVSKCGAVIEDKTRRWLEGNGFYEQTGFSPENLRFCIGRADKAPIVQELGITDFVDDKEEVLGYMKGIVGRRYLFGPQRQEPSDGDLIIAETWKDVLLYAL